MKNFLVSKAMIMIAAGLLAAATSAQSNDATSSTPGVSKVRIVRLSQVKGSVKIDRHIGHGFEPAIANLPVVEQSQVWTGMGVAEIEFEDNSSLRLAPNSAVEFPRLEREASGATLSEVRLLQGTAYISLVKPLSKKSPANQFNVIFGARKLELAPATHIRLDIAGTEAKVSVMDGAVNVPGETLASIPKKKTATFQIFDENEATVAKDVEPGPFDEWDHTSASYHANVAAYNAFNSPYSYGLSDMAYYGSFMNANGCGMMWRPYFTSADWDPYANGTWAWYQGAGYSWVSPYPWGWTPYHSGAWSYCPNVGWGWMPGDNWYGINNVAALSPVIGGGSVPGSRNPGRIPHVPLRPPQANQPALIAVNEKPLSMSRIASSRSFVFQKDSAGLGVPRGTMGKLDKFSRETVARGAVSTHIYASAPEMSRQGGSMTQSMAATVHRGYAPEPMPTSTSRGSYSSGSSSGWSGTGSSIPSAGATMRSSMPAPAPVASSSAGGTRK
jgi:hypothetical protein